MNFTLQHLTEFVKENPEAIVYFHPEKTWWTHTSDDFYRLTDEQFSDQMTRLQAVVDGENYPQENRDKAAALIIQANKVRKSGHAIPMAPDQCPLQMMSIVKFLQLNFNRGTQIGGYGILNIMFGHAQNCEGNIASNWSWFDIACERLLTSNKPVSSTAYVTKQLNELKSELMKHNQKSSKPKIIPITSAKIGRNDQCPCGSGKKYKFCHGGEQ